MLVVGVSEVSVLADLGYRAHLAEPTLLCSASGVLGEYDLIVSRLFSSIGGSDGVVKSQFLKLAAFLKNRVSVCYPGYLETHSVDKAGLELRDHLPVTLRPAMPHPYSCASLSCLTAVSQLLVSCYCLMLHV